MYFEKHYSDLGTSAPTTYAVKVSNDTVENWPADPAVTFTDSDGKQKARYTITFTPTAPVAGGPNPWSVRVSPYNSSVTDPLPPL
jgi:hypothetical protein